MNTQPCTLFRRTALALSLFAAVALAPGCIEMHVDMEPELMKAAENGIEAGAVLDTLHDAAAKADGSRYWSCFAPNAVFLGTDATERWTLEEFKAYADARFKAGKGWTYTPGNRNLWLSADGNVAWFDEVVTNAKYGACRGTGVLVKLDDKWKIVQYNLTLPIPNDLMDDLAPKIKAFIAGQQK